MGTERPPYVPPHQKPGPAVDRIEFSKHGIDQAVASLRRGEIDIYEFGLKVTAARDLKNVDDTQRFCAPSGSVSLILNPAPAPEGQLNPFSLERVRQMVNYLVDREYIAGDIYGGFAVPQFVQVSQLDYDWLITAETAYRSQIRYDLDFAKREIAKEMKAAGAELIDDKWHYNGQLIRLKFIIRVEDERRDVGDAIRANLEHVGFEVIPILKRFAAAISTVYTSDPVVFEWHLYTEGWGRTSAERYDSLMLNQFTAPWMTQMPGAQIFGFWQYEHERLDEIGQKVFAGKFTSQEERDALYREATGIALDEAVRIWVVTLYNIFPAVQELAGVTEDVSAGPRGQLGLREAYIPGEDTLRVGSLWVWTERSIWNPIGGFIDLYSRNIYQHVVDPLVINDPSSGVPIPFRAEFDIETAGPNGKLAVPSDAVMWNADPEPDCKEDCVEGRWEPVASGTEATSRVVFDLSKYTSSVWHHEQPITMADMLYGIASRFERADDPVKQRIEFVLAATSKPVLEVFRGFRILDENRIEIYLDFWHFEESYIASYALNAAGSDSLAMLSTPWEVLVASDVLVYERKKGAYSQAASARYNVKWLDFAQESHAVLVANELGNLLRKGTVPEEYFEVNGVSYVTAEEAAARYQAAIDFFEQYRHVVISQGPFVLTDYQPSKQYAELTAFRHDTYPFKPGDWYRERVEQVRFADINVPSDAETITVALEGEGALELHYLLVDPSSGSVLASGQSTLKSGDEFEIVLDPDVLKPFSGRYLDLILLASSDATAIVTQEVIQFQA